MTNGNDNYKRRRDTTCSIVQHHILYAGNLILLYRVSGNCMGARAMSKDDMWDELPAPEPQVDELRAQVITGICYLLNDWTGKHDPSYIVSQYYDKKLLTLITTKRAEWEREARLNQIMRDFLKTDICTDIDESILIDIRKSQEEQVEDDFKELKEGK